MRRKVVLLGLVLFLGGCSSPSNVAATQTRESNLNFWATYAAPTSTATLTPVPTPSQPIATAGLPTATGGPPTTAAYAAEMSDAFLYVGAAIQHIAAECVVSIERCTSAYTVDQDKFGRGALRLRNLAAPPPACRDLRSRYLAALTQADAYLADLSSPVKAQAWPTVREITNRDIPAFTLTVSQIGTEIRSGVCH